VSQSCASVLQRECFPWASIGVIPNAIQAKPAAALPTSVQPEWRHASMVIGFIGEIHPRKGLDVLLASLARLPHGFNLVLIGNGSENYTRHLKGIVHDMELTEHVFFLGFRENGSELLQHCDVVVLPSIAYESFGMVLLEAMYWKKPVICSDFGGMKEVVVHEQTGLIVPAGNADELGRALKYLFDNPETGVQWGHNGYRRLKKHYDIEMLAKRYCRLS
jgi:glycosyltransferase involved in cell wall biosynthesis